MKLFRICFFVLFVAAAVASGQTRSGDVIVDVPFDFSAAGQTLHSGHYIVASHDDMIRIFNAQTRGIYIPTHAAIRSKSDGSKLVFHRYGNSYFLSAVWVTGNTIGKELFRSQAERELQTRKSEMELAIVRPAQ